MSDPTDNNSSDVLGMLPEEQDEDMPTAPGIAPEEGIRPIRLSSVFNDPTANVVFKTSDNVLFRVDDFFLKANRYVGSAVYIYERCRGVTKSPFSPTLPILVPCSGICSVAPPHHPLSTIRFLSTKNHPTSAS